MPVSGQTEAIIAPGVSTTVENPSSPLAAGEMRGLLRYGEIDLDRFNSVDSLVDAIVELRQNTIPAWLTECADEIASSNATLVGFTCMFDQTIASAAVARLVKQRCPNTLVAFGGIRLQVKPARKSCVVSRGLMRCVSAKVNTPLRLWHVLLPA
jgi:hypothetical protein